MTVSVFVKLDSHDEPLPLSDLSWELVAPCGCTSGCMVAETADEEAALREFIPNAEKRKRNAVEGFVFRLGLHREVAARIQDRCQHEPRYGVDRAPIPPGHRWAQSRGVRRIHLVRVPAEAPEYSFQEFAVPLCGAKRNLWTQDWDDWPTCRPCEKAAREMAAAGEPS